MFFWNVVCKKTILQKVFFGGDQIPQQMPLFP